MQIQSVLGDYYGTFLADYWQKRALLIRQAFPGGLQLLSADELAGLACEDGVEARLVLEHGKKPWEVQHGPFDAELFQRLPATHWTLLVQAVDRLLPEVAALRSLFSFIPNWRIDDVMISYAADQGSVGPHTDHYDVFLIQGQGRRHWSIGGQALERPELLPGLDMKILREFETEQSWVLEPGDMLYLPPRYAHHGVALGESITYSVGFRAPSQREMMLSYMQFLAQQTSEEVFYQDRSLRLGREPGLILPEELEDLWQLLQKDWNRPDLFRRWIGAFLTEPRSFHAHDPEASELAEGASGLTDGPDWEWAEGIKISYFLAEDRLFLGVEGETFVLPAEFEPLAALLSRQMSFSRPELQPLLVRTEGRDLLDHLVTQGLLRARPEDSSEG